MITTLFGFFIILLRNVNKISGTSCLFRQTKCNIRSGADYLGHNRKTVKAINTFYKTFLLSTSRKSKEQGLS